MPFAFLVLWNVGSERVRYGLEEFVAVPLIGDKIRLAVVNDLLSVWVGCGWHGSSLSKSLDAVQDRRRTAATNFSTIRSEQIESRCA